MDLETATTAAASEPAGSASPDFDLAVQMLELNAMRADGTISEEEFAGWVAELLPTG